MKIKDVTPLEIIPLSTINNRLVFTGWYRSSYKNGKKYHDKYYYIDEGITDGINLNYETKRS